VDLERHTLVEVLADRTSGIFASWPKEHQALKQSAVTTLSHSKG